MGVDKYLIYDENIYAIEIFNEILKGIDSLYQYKTLNRNKVKDKLHILKEKSRQYEDVVDSMAISRIISSDKEYFTENWEEIKYIHASLKYYEKEVEYIEKLINEIKEIKKTLLIDTSELKKEVDDKKNIDEDLLKLNKLLYIKSFLSAQIAIESTIIGNIKSELYKINSFGTYNIDNIINFIKLDSNTRITDILLNEWIRISDVDIDQGIIKQINIFNNIFSEYILNHTIIDTLEVIDVVSENLNKISDKLKKDVEKEEVEFLRLKEISND